MLQKMQAGGSTFWGYVKEGALLIQAQSNNKPKPGDRCRGEVDAVLISIWALALLLGVVFLLTSLGEPTEANPDCVYYRPFEEIQAEYQEMRAVGWGTLLGGTAVAITHLALRGYFYKQVEEDESYQQDRATFMQA